ncbi:unnamed protein product, partial [Ectocarpus fasciculatus]
RQRALVPPARPRKDLGAKSGCGIFRGRRREGPARRLALLSSAGEIRNNLGDTSFCAAVRIPGCPDSVTIWCPPNNRSSLFLSYFAVSNTENLVYKVGCLV